MAVDYATIRAALAELPRSDSHAPGDPVEPADVYTPGGHRGALDPDRVLVVGNRGVGKSYWAHALLNPEIRERIAAEYRQPTLRDTTVLLGFNASDRANPVAPTPGVLSDARGAGIEPDIIWRTVLLRAVRNQALLPERPPLPDGFLHLCRWVSESSERYERLMTEADDQLHRTRARLLVAFDALDRLGTTWDFIRPLTRELLRRALAARSYRSIRIKVFMRADQFDDSALFDFPDASKVKNDRVVLEWEPVDLYGLLLEHIRRSVAKEAIEALGLGPPLPLPAHWSADGGDVAKQKRIIDAIAGEYMGAGKKRGRVYSWLPLHLGDARGKTSPRTFLTAWREAARQGSLPVDRAVDHLGIAEGVRKASEDRLAELEEDYPWIRLVLQPLRGQMVPIERPVLEAIWSSSQTVEKVLESSLQSRWLGPVQLTPGERKGGSLLVDALRAIGVLEIRSSGKINVPDIFRVEAGIRRKGGVRPPTRPGTA